MWTQPVNPSPGLLRGGRFFALEPPELMSNLSVLQELMVATAWADGRLDQREAEILRRVLANGQVSVSEIETCLREPTVDLDSVLNRITSGPQREEIMREVLLMCAVDGEMASWELVLIGRLAGHLGLTPEQLQELVP